MFGGTRHEKTSLPHPAWHLAMKCMDVPAKGIATKSGWFSPADLMSPEDLYMFQYLTSLTTGLHFWRETSGFLLPPPSRNIPLKMLCFIRNAVSKCKMKKENENKAEKNHFLSFCKWGEEGRQGISSNLKRFNIFRNSCQQKTSFLQLLKNAQFSVKNPFWHCVAAWLPSSGLLCAGPSTWARQTWSSFNPRMG